jgi:hypothetical protein
MEVNVSIHGTSLCTYSPIPAFTLHVGKHCRHWQLAHSAIGRAQPNVQLTPAYQLTPEPTDGS